MRKPIIAITAVAALCVPAGAELPASFDVQKIATCNPDTLDRAVDCLRTTMEAADVKALSDRQTSRRYRGHLDEMLRVHWKLRDPRTPLVRFMTEHGIFGSAASAPGIVISSLQAQASGEGFDYRAVSAALRAMPPAVDHGPPPPDAFDVPTGAVVLPLSKCSSFELPDDAVVSNCLQMPDGITRVEVEMPQKNSENEDSDGR